MCVRAVESVRCSASAHAPQRLAETESTLLRGLSWFQQFSLGREMTHPAGLCPQPAGLLGGLCGGACFSTTRSGSGVWNLVLFRVVPVWLADTGVTSGTTRFNVNAPLKGTSQLLSALCRNSGVPVPSFLSDPQTLQVCLGRSPRPARTHRSLDWRPLPLLLRAQSQLSCPPRSGPASLRLCSRNPDQTRWRGRAGARAPDGGGRQRRPGGGTRATDRPLQGIPRMRGWRRTVSGSSHLAGVGEAPRLPFRLLPPSFHDEASERPPEGEWVRAPEILARVPPSARCSNLVALLIFKSQ